MLHDFAVVDPQPPAPAFDPMESLEAFAHIGYGGTPPGMITSGWSNTATGQIGGGEVTEDKEDTPLSGSGRVGAAPKVGVAALLVCVGALGFVLYMRMKGDAPTPTTATEPERIIVAPPPTSELEQVPSVASAAARESGHEVAQSAEPDSRKRKTKSERARKPSEPRQSCKVTVEEAERAGRRGRWDDTERLTRQFPQCWNSTLERKKLRMRALFELDRFEECIKLGRGSSNATIERLANGCREASRK